MYVTNIKSMLISSSEFINNYAGTQGGAIYTNCDETFDCTLDFRKQITFTLNQAEISGGAIYWRDVEPNMTIKDHVFINNSAGIYADDIGSFP